MSEAVIELRQFEVVRDARTLCWVDDLTVSNGDRVAVVGANGAGKTTLLRTLAGLNCQFAGKCRVATPRREITFVHQRPYLFRGSVMSNLNYAQRGRGPRKNSAGQWLERLGLAHLANRTRDHLSGGELRRVALARALACEPKLLILDEPLAELDPESSELVCRVLNELPDATLVVASPVELPPSLHCRTYTLIPSHSPTPSS
jgi:ABC-type multidrug transport system ATPase subunit